MLNTLYDYVCGFCLPSCVLSHDIYRELIMHDKICLLEPEPTFTSIMYRMYPYGKYFPC